MNRTVLLWGIFLLGLVSKEITLIVFLPVLLSSKTKDALVLLSGMALIVIALFTWRYHLGIHNPSIEIDSLIFLSASSQSFSVEA